MAVVTFLSAIDFSTLDPTNWFDVNATNTSATSMDFVDGDQTINVQGSGFTYFFGIPMTGTVTSMVATGPINGSITGLNVAISDVSANIDDTEALLDLFFGGRDVIKGSAGADVLFGFGDNDNLKGGKGADLLNGGEGADKLTGGRGSDTFQLNLITDTSKKHPDLITDLEDNDKIDLTILDVLGNIVATYNEVKDVTTFAIDTNGNGTADAWLAASGDHTSFDNFII